MLNYTKRESILQDDHSTKNIKYTDISLMVRGTPAHVKCYSYLGMLIPGTWIPESRVAYPGPDPSPVKPAICPVTANAFIKALTARVATYRRVLHWLQQKMRSRPCVNSLLIIIAHAAR